MVQTASVPIHRSHRPRPQTEDNPHRGIQADESLDLVASSRPHSLRRLGPWAAPAGLWAGGAGGTHIDEVVPVADEQVAQDAGLVEVPQADHVLHAVDRRGVHGLDVWGLLRGDPVFL